MLDHVLADFALLVGLMLLCWVYSGPPHRGYVSSSRPITQADLPRMRWDASGALRIGTGQQRAHGAIDLPQGDRIPDPPPCAWSGKRLYHCPGCRCSLGSDVDTMSAGT